MSLFLLVPWVDTNAQSIIYLEENFDNVSSLPPGWTISGTTTSVSNNWNLFSGTSALPAYSSPNCIRANSATNTLDATSVVMTPSVNIASPDARLSFYVKNPKGGNLSVYVSTDDGATYLQNVLDTALVNVSDWTKKSYDLNDFYGQNIKVVFVAVSNKSSNAYQFLDDIRIYEKPTCAQPENLIVSSVTQNSANLYWSLDDEGATPTSYLISVQKQDGSYVLNNFFFYYFRI